MMLNGGPSGGMHPLCLTDQAEAGPRPCRTVYRYVGSFIYSITRHHYISTGTGYNGAGLMFTN